MLDFDSEDIDGMDDDAGDNQEPAPTGHWKATSIHDIYMVDTPKGSDNEEQRDTAKDNSPEKQPKRRRKRLPKSRLDNNNTHNDPAIEQGRPVTNMQPSNHPNRMNRIINSSSMKTTVRTISRRTHHRLTRAFKKGLSPLQEV